MIHSLLSAILRIFAVSTVMLISISSAYASSPAKPYIAWMADPTSANFDLSWDMWWGENGTTVKLEENGTIVNTITIATNSPQAQKGKFSLSNKTNGVFSYRVLLCNTTGCTPSDVKAVTVKLTSATPVTPTNPIVSNPSRPYIAWMADPTSSQFALSWDMWWGENGTTVKLEENGTIVDTLPVTTNSPQAQKGTFTVSNKTNGTFSYRVLLCNSSGCTPSDVKAVTVKLTSATPVTPTDPVISNPSPPSSGDIILSEDLKRMIRSATPIQGTPIIDLGQSSNNPANVVRVMRIFPESKWNEIFPVRKSIYTYTEFLKSVAKFPAFCNEMALDSGMDIDTACKTELATVFAHMVQETGGHSPSGYLDDNLGTTYEEWKQGLYYIREVYCNTLGTGCEYRGDTCSPDNYFGKIWPCPVGANYYGRGAHQLSYNFNYGIFSEVIFGDANVLLRDPDRVAREGWLAMSSAIWFYMTPQSPKPSMHDVVVGYWKPNASDLASGNRRGFCATTNIINGGIECGKGTETAGSLNRIKYYKAMITAVGGMLGTNLDCGISQYFSVNGSAMVLSYFEENWDGTQGCHMVSWQTGFSVFVPDAYRRCVEYYFHVTPTIIPVTLTYVPAVIAVPQSAVPVNNKIVVTTTTQNIETQVSVPPSTAYTLVQNKKLSTRRVRVSRKKPVTCRKILIGDTQIHVVCR